MKYKNQRELAKELGVTRMSVSNWIREGLPHVRVGMSYLFDGQQVANWLEEHEGRKHLAEQLKGK